MNYCIRFSENVYNMLVNHTLKDSNRECGGFLYGSLYKDCDNLYYNVDDIYYEEIYGNENEFRFGFKYICNGLRKEKELSSLILIGTYHSHGNYSAELSSVDRDELQKFFGENKITIVYSPKYKKMIGEVLESDGKSYKASVLVKK